ncbi:MAG: DUF1285 domain-containing protein [Bacillota bacterium]
MVNQELRIDQEGTWYWEGQEMTRLDIVLMFAKHMVQDAQGGYRVVMDGQCHPVVVEDVPFVVREVEVKESGITLNLKDGRQIPMPAGKVVLKADVPYLSLFHGLDTKFSRHAWWQLHNFIKETKEGFQLAAGGSAWPLVMEQTP